MRRQQQQLLEQVNMPLEYIGTRKGIYLLLPRSNVTLPFLKRPEPSDGFLKYLEDEVSGYCVPD
jgi:hypothetical protein